MNKKRMYIMPKIINYSKNSFKKWTVAISHWKSEDFLFWQLKLLYDFHNPSEFELLIFDSMFPVDDLEVLENLIQPYRHHQNIKIFQWENIIEKGTPHGSEMNILLQNANSKYILFNDPDCFWFAKSYLNFLSKFLEHAFKVVGVQHNKMVGPAIWGSAYHLSDIKNCDLQATWFLCENCGKNMMAPMQDTGWQLHVKTNHLPTFIFDTHFCQLPNLGKINSYRRENYQGYKYKNEMIAIHFFRGIYSTEEPSEKTPEACKKARFDYGKYFYENLKQIY